MLITIYCSGGIKKGPQDDAKLCWTDRERDEFATGANAEVIFLEPADPVIDVTDEIALFGRDMYQVMIADAVVVDGRQRRGIGIGVEMATSRMLDTRLVAVLPPESHYRRSNVTYRGGTAANYVHPHVFGLCDAIVDDFTAAGAWVAEQVRLGQSGAGIDSIHAAITAYRQRLLPQDQPMLDANRRSGRSD
jgi:hypothetical protein